MKQLEIVCDPVLIQMHKPGETGEIRRKGNIRRHTSNGKR
ncbi:hypothetical protein C5167_040593 [Papaver somniferum]|uniref:Uncharacterized protein n=1 Tax=Papaver somniferum TaxID=3469 RepID=A0A4Y7IIW9_PAPSO|nr:hypothetical protein C5167_040593 [Papaver somniferum]